MRSEHEKFHETLSAMFCLNLAADLGMVKAVLLEEPKQKQHKSNQILDPASHYVRDDAHGDCLLTVQQRVLLLLDIGCIRAGRLMMLLWSPLSHAIADTLYFSLALFASLRPVKGIFNLISFGKEAKQDW